MIDKQWRLSDLLKTSVASSVHVHATMPGATKIVSVVGLFIFLLVIPILHIRVFIFIVLIIAYAHIIVHTGTAR